MIFPFRSVVEPGSGRLAVGFLLALVLAAEPVLGAAVQGEPTADPAAAAPDSLAAPNPAAVDVTPPELDIWDTGVSPTTAVLVSPLFPGWGQLYTENSWRAALAFGAEMYFWTNLIGRDQRARRSSRFADGFLEDSPDYRYYNTVAEEDWNQMRDYAWWSGGALLILALDAYVGAHLFNFGQDPLPVPNRWEDTFGLPGTGMPGGVLTPQLTVLQWRKTF